MPVSEDQRESASSFLQAAYHGDRYDGGRLPLEVTPDLAALGDLLVELCRHILRSESVTPKRLPKGFSKRASLAVTQLADGSAELMISGPADAAIDLGVPVDLMDRSRNLFLETISRVGDDQPPPDLFPPELLGRFNKIGRRLRPGEWIEFSLPRQQNRFCRYDLNVRARLLASTERSEEDLTLVGVVQAVDGTGERKSFKIVTEKGPIAGVFPTELDPDFRRAIAEASTSGRYLDGSMPYSVEGTGSFQRGKLVGFTAESISYVEFDGNTSIAEVFNRVRDLVNMPAGWLNGSGERVSPDLAERFLQVLVVMADEESLAPYVYPTEVGGLRAEWDVRGQEVVWQLDPNDTFAFTRELNHTAHTEVELDIEDLASISRELSAFISQKGIASS